MAKYIKIKDRANEQKPQETIEITPKLWELAKEFLLSIEHNHFLKSHETKRLLELYNEAFSRAETGISCSSCITRAYNSLKAYVRKMEIEG
jgi:hypothetical protein